MTIAADQPSRRGVLATAFALRRRVVAIQESWTVVELNMMLAAVAMAITLLGAGPLSVDRRLRLTRGGG